MSAQRVFQVADDLAHRRFREGIKEIHHKRLVGKRKRCSILAYRLKRKAFLGFALVLTQVLLRDLVKGRQKLHTDDPAEGIVRRHQQGAPFARAKIDEGEVAEVESGLVGRWGRPQRVEHLMKRCWLG